jgi:hypothetical protein
VARRTPLSSTAPSPRQRCAPWRWKKNTGYRPQILAPIFVPHPTGVDLDAAPTPRSLMCPVAVNPLRRLQEGRWYGPGCGRSCAGRSGPPHGPPALLETGRQLRWPYMLEIMKAPPMTRMTIAAIT